MYLYNKTEYRYGNLLATCYSICSLFFISSLFFQYLLSVTTLPLSKILIIELNITITKLTSTYMRTCIYKDANVYVYVQVTFHTLVPSSSTNTIIIWSLWLLRHHTVRMWFTELVNGMLWLSLSQTFLLADFFWLQKITSNVHIFAHVNTECPDDRYPKLDINISELILDIYEYIYIYSIRNNTLHVSL
jgi:hypothetical protein